MFSLDASPYQAYVYSYPHKTAYRPLDPPRRLTDVWATEAVSALFGYVHVPFCEFRCGFCNLFTLAESQPPIDRYLDALAKQMAQTKAALPDSYRFARLALGGGTPTVLDAAALDRVFVMMADLGADATQLPSSVEVSPATVDVERLAVLSAWGIDRVSIGIQSFSKLHAGALGRPQDPEVVHAALRAIRKSGFGVLNLDLIYGAQTQTPETMIADIDAALAYEPEELYLYPLYVRPLTGLGKKERRESDPRIALYRAARDHLVHRGYTQVSMRMFRGPHTPDLEGPAYCCQRDGMVGLGPGARSYTTNLHYSFDYAVTRSAIRGIVDDYLDSSPADFDTVDRGFVLSKEERRRRFVLQSLFLVSGLDRAAYRDTFQTDVMDDFPELETLADRDWAQIFDARVILTAAGLERSDAIGPWLFSEAVTTAMNGYELR